MPIRGIASGLCDIRGRWRVSLALGTKQPFSILTAKRLKTRGYRGHRAVLPFPARKHSPNMKITIETTVAAPIEEVWRAWTTPDDIKQWNAASDDWHTTASTVDLRVGGAFSSRMEAKDGSFGFDFAGTYTRVVPHERIEMEFGGRTALVEFLDRGGSVVVRESFDAEETHSIEQQRQGWQAILNRFARHVESRR